MQLTKHNYLEHRDQIDWSRMPAALTGDTKSLVDDIAAEGFKDTNPEVTEAVDKFFKLSNMVIGRDGTLVKGNTPPQTDHEEPAEKQKKEKKVRAPRIASKPPVVKKAAIKSASKKPKRESKPKTDPFYGKPVEHIASDTQFIKRYVSLHGKTKSAEDLAKLLHGLQKAVLEKRVTSKSPHAAELEEMQSSLKKAIEGMDGAGTIKVVIDAKRLAHYQKIAKSEEAMPSVKLLKQYINISGKRGQKMKARKLKETMWKAVDAGKIKQGDPYEEQLDAAWRSLNIFCDEKVPTLDLHEYELAGLGSITGHEIKHHPGASLAGIHTKSHSLFSKAHHGASGPGKKKVRKASGR